MTTTRTIIGVIGDVVIPVDDAAAKAAGLRSGQRLEIVGFEPTSYGRTHNHGLPPGLYHNPAYPMVRPEGGAPLVMGRHLLVPEPGRTERVVPRASLKTAELPDSEFHEMDTVRLPDGGEAVVLMVNHLAIATAPAGSGKPYVCETAPGVRVDLAASELALVARGPVWRRAHGETLAFDGPAEEGEFHRAVGECDEVRCPSNGNFAWTRDEAIEALLSGDVHGFHGDDIPGGDSGLYMIRFRDEAVGEAVRGYTLARLDGSPAGPAP